jgi:hypothetical protein
MTQRPSLAAMETELPAPDMSVNGSAVGRAIVICDQWLGSDGYGGMKALRRAGWDVHALPEWEYIPSKYRSRHMKAAAKLLRPLAVREYNRELELQARRLEPDMLLVFKGVWVQGSAIRALRAHGVRCYN